MAKACKMPGGCGFAPFFKGCCEEEMKAEYKLVPVELTEEMIEANRNAAPTEDQGSGWTQWAPRARWKAMLNAAPEPKRGDT